VRSWAVSFRAESALFLVFMDSASSFLHTVEYLLGAVRELARYVLRFTRAFVFVNN
jgi:hypothetical protein